MKITRRQLKRLIEASVSLSDEEKEEIKKAKDNAIKKIADQSPGINPDEVEDSYEKSKEEVNEELERLSYASKELGYTYGLDHVSKKDKASDDIIGHT